MRLHLVISRHGLPVTRILWTTTSSSSALGEYGSHQPASASMVASSRTPNIAFANGGYTIAQLLEDVNEVVPLETEPTIFDPEFSGQWGLEDYVVEVGGSECLHFMEVDGLLRDGDEVVIRALQLADLRARRICGRHQITGDGKHLIDGVPFGMPFYKRTTSTRPAITIPPRKKRRTVFSGWNQGPVYGQDGAHDGPHGDRAGDEEWLPENNVPFGKELSVLPADHEVSDMGTVIRHPVNYSGDVDELMDDSEEESYQTGSDEDEADIDDEADELEDELKALKEEFEISEPRIIGISSQPRESTGPALRASSIAKRPLSSESQGKSSLAGASSLSSKRSAGNEGSSPRISKAVRFNRGTPLPSMATVQALENEAASSSTESSDSSDSSAESEDEEDEDEDENSSDEGSSDDEVSASSSADPDDSNDTGTTSSSEDTSESEAEMPNLPASRKPQPYLVNPPGMGSTRTKKSNMRFKQRRRLSKLKELGILPENADFAALREWEDKNGGFHIPEGTSVLSAPASTAQRKEDEQREFEARREKLLRDLATGGVNVDEAPGKKRKQPSQSVDHDSVEKTAATKDATTAETSDRRKLDIESSRRMLFGSLGVRTPKTEDDVEATRRKLAAQASTVHSQRAKAPRPREEDLDEESDANDDWEKKLVIKAVECIHDDVVMTAPPFPFEQRWDGDADALIRQRNGWGKKRKRKQRVHIYDGDGQDEYDDHYGHEAYGDHANEAHRLNYDDEWPTAEDDTTQLGGHQSNPEASSVDDLPMMPHDPSTLADLPQKDIKVGSIIAYQRLEMSKATNWQPRLSEYRVAEVHEVLGDGNLKIRRALRDRRPKAETVDSEDDQPRTYSGFEMPGMDDDGEEDDGFDEVNVADLAGPKLLRPATMSVNDVANDEAGENGKSRDAAKEGSTVSVVEDSMPNNEPDMSSPPSIDVDMDETTFVTLETADSRLPSPRGSTTGAAVAASSRTPAAARVVITRSRYADDEYSESPAVPSPVFSGFHSARSSPGARLGRRYHDAGDSGLDGHTLIGDQSMLAVDPSNQDWSTHTSFLSANQSFSDTQQDSTQQDRQVVENDHIFASNESLVSVVHHPAEAVESHLTKPSPSPSAIPESPTSTKEQEDGKASPAQGSSIKELLNIGWPAPGDTDAERDEVDDDANDQDDQDSLIHSNQSRDLSSRLSSRSITSAQRALGSSPCLAVDSLQELVSPTTSTRSRRPRQSSPSLLDASQTSQVIDLTQSPLLRPSPDASALQSDQQPSAEKNTENDHPSSSGKARQSLGRIQEMAEVVVSPGPSQKAKKKKKKRRVGTDA